MIARVLAVLIDIVGDGRTALGESAGGDALAPGERRGRMVGVMMDGFGRSAEQY